MTISKIHPKDYDVQVQKSFALAQEVPYPDFVKDEYDQLSVLKICKSKAVNKEWLFHGLGPPVAYAMNFSSVKLHDGFKCKVSRMAVNIQNPGNQKDAVCDLVMQAVLKVQQKEQHLMLLDEFTPEYLYETLKANGGRALGVYSELRACFNGLNARAGQSTVSPKERIIRLYEHNRWAHGVKGEAAFTYDAAEQMTLSKGLFCLPRCCSTRELVPIAMG